MKILNKKKAVKKTSKTKNSIFNLLLTSIFKQFKLKQKKKEDYLART
jgi:hypothetical protein